MTRDDKISASMRLGQFHETFIFPKNGTDPSVIAFIDQLKSRQ